MTYPQIQYTFARYGFINCPITKQGFKELIALGFGADDIYSIGCDIASGSIELAQAPQWVEQYGIEGQDNG